jgi:hypothetical protein
MNPDWLFFHSLFILLKHPAASVTAIGFMVWHVEAILKMIEISFDIYDLLIDGQSSEWSAIRYVLLFTLQVPTLVFISFSVLFLLPALERWISL